MHRLPSALLIALVACTPEPSLPAQDTEVEGIVFKGPMVAGSEVVIQPLDPQFAPMGEPVTASIDIASGRYTARVEQHRGLVQITAQGAHYDEAERGPTQDPILLSAFAVLEGASDTLHLNLLGDLSRAQVRAELLKGTPPVEAIEGAERAVIDALQLGGTAPVTPSSRLDVYQNSVDAGWLFGASAVLSELGAQRGDPSALYDQLRADIAAGALDPSVVAALDQTEADLDPAHTVDRLEAYFRDLGIDETLPDAGDALDSDGDGVPNTTDVCPFVADPDQTTTAGGWGTACDSRLLTMDASDGFGCGIRADNNELTCWHLDDEAPGGQPPRPDNLPVAQFGPWRDDPGLTGPFDALTMGPGIVCGSRVGDLSCWSSERGLWTLDGPFVDLDSSQDRLCVLTEAQDVRCYDHSGAELYDIVGPWSAMTTIGADGVCTLDNATSTLSCFDGTGVLAPLADMPTGPQNAVEGDDTGPGAGTTIDADGSTQPFGEQEFFFTFPDVASTVMGRGIICVNSFQQGCGWDPFYCDGVDNLEIGPGPFFDLTYVAATDCLVCGLDPDGFGWCIPNVDYR